MSQINVVSQTAWTDRRDTLIRGSEQIPSDRESDATFPGRSGYT